MIKLHKINIVASLIMIALTIVTCIFSFISFVSVFHLILAIVNILWVDLVLVISFKSKSSKKDKIFYLLGSLWSLLMSVNFIFLYFNIFLEFAILSSIILLV